MALLVTLYKIPSDPLKDQAAGSDDSPGGRDHKKIPHGQVGTQQASKEEQEVATGIEHLTRTKHYLQEDNADKNFRKHANDLHEDHSPRFE